MSITAAQPTSGQELYMGDDAGTLVLIGELTDVRPPNTSRNMINATTHGATADNDGGVPQQFVPAGTYDPGDIQFTVNEIPGSVTAESLEAAFATAAKKYFKLVDGTANPPKFRAGYGFVATYAPASRAALGEAVKTAQVTVKRSGPWTRGDA